MPHHDKHDVSPARVAQCLGGLSFPCSKDELVSYARSHGCSDEPLTALDQIPEKKYGSMADLMSGIGDKI